MHGSDVPVAYNVTRAAMGTLRRALAPASAPTAPEPTSSEVERWHRRAHHLLGTDPNGCWVAEDGGDVIGIAMALRRDKLWGLSALFVRPDHQAAGVGSALLDAVLAYSVGCLSGIIISTEDPHAARRYRLAGFTLHPTIRASGTVNHTAIPVVDGVRVGGPGDDDLADSVDRQIRGAARRADHEWWAREYAMFVCDAFTGSGYCYVDERGSPMVLAATNRKIAQRLLWSALAQARDDEPISIGFLSAAQEWAVDVALAAGLSLRTEGYLCLRHLRPPAPYIPSGPFL